MADQVTAQDSGTSFVRHDEGQFAAVCVDVVDLGQRLEQFAGKPPRIVNKCALVFLTSTDGETKDVSAEMTVSMGEKSNLRKFLEDWRGKGYSEEQVRAGVPLHKLVGHGALISVEHKKSAKDRTYAKIKTVMPLPKGMVAPASEPYTRAPFWVERKKAYAEEAARWASSLAKADDLPPEPEGEDDDLPF